MSKDNRLPHQSLSPDDIVVGQSSPQSGGSRSGAAGESVGRSAEPGRVSKEDIASKLRLLDTAAHEAADSSKQTLSWVVIGATALAVVIAYLVGRKMGNRKQAFIEIRRV